MDDAYAALRQRPTPIPTPMSVRLEASALVGVSLGALWSQHYVLGLLAVVGAFALALLHPYRRRMKAYADTIPTVTQLIPLMVWWVAGMLAPLIHLPLWGALLVGVGVFLLAFWLFPHVDGTRKLAFL